MDCDNCRAIAKQLRIEEGNQLNIPGNGGRRGSTPWSAPCSRKSSCPGPGILGITGSLIFKSFLDKNNVDGDNVYI